MYCFKCGKEIPDSSTFCSFCGAAQQNAPQAATKPQSVRYKAPASARPAAAQPAPAAQAPEKKKKWKKTTGIVLMVLGGLSVLGSLSNGFYANMGPDLADFTALAIQAGFLFGGFRLISKS